jgi:hypothetical protein
VDVRCLLRWVRSAGWVGWRSLFKLSAFSGRRSARGRGGERPGDDWGAVQADLLSRKCNLAQPGAISSSSRRMHPVSRQRSAIKNYARAPYQSPSGSGRDGHAGPSLAGGVLTGAAAAQETVRTQHSAIRTRRSEERAARSGRGCGPDGSAFS